MLMALLFLIFSSFAQARTCHFLCQEVPPPTEILKSYGQGSNEALPRSLRVVAWNLYKGRKAGFARELERLLQSSALQLFSEVVWDKKMSGELLQSEEAWQMATSFLMRDHIATGVASGSKVFPLSVDYRRTEDLEPFVESPKVLLLTEYALAGHAQTLLAVNIHGINWAGDAALERQVRAVLPTLKAHAGPVIFAGDFNFKNAARRDRISALLSQEAGLKRVPWSNAQAGEKLLDDAFTRDLRVEDAVIDREVEAEGSDHPALLLTLSVP